MTRNLCTAYKTENGINQKAQPHNRLHRIGGTAGIDATSHSLSDLVLFQLSVIQEDPLHQLRAHQALLPLHDCTHHQNQ